MAVEWPTLSINMSQSSTIDREPNLEIFKMGDGAVLRFGIGINNDPGTFNIVYEMMPRTDYIILRDFVKMHRKTGKAIRIPLMPEDPTGATFGYFYITKSNIDGGWAPTITVTAEECFTDD